MSFANKLRCGRKKKQLTQEKLAELLDVSRQSISEWERGKKYPDSEKLIKLVKALDMSMDWLFEDELSSNLIATTSQTIPAGVIAGLEAFSSKINDLMGQQNEKPYMKKG